MSDVASEFKADINTIFTGDMENWIYSAEARSHFKAGKVYTLMWVESDPIADTKTENQ